MSGLHFSKPEPRKRTKARAKRVKAAAVKAVRALVFAREQDICRCCGFRLAESMHEIKSRGAGGKVSLANSIAVCGKLVGGFSCHTYLQRAEITVRGTKVGAEGWLAFKTKTRAAADVTGVMVGTERVSVPGSGYLAFQEDVDIAAERTMNLGESQPGVLARD